MEYVSKFYELPSETSSVDEDDYFEMMRLVQRAAMPSRSISTYSSAQQKIKTNRVLKTEHKTRPPAATSAIYGQDSIAYPFSVNSERDKNAKIAGKSKISESHFTCRKASMQVCCSNSKAFSASTYKTARKHFDSCMGALNDSFVRAKPDYQTFINLRRAFNDFVKLLEIELNGKAINKRHSKIENEKENSKQQLEEMKKALANNAKVIAELETLRLKLLEEQRQTEGLRKQIQQLEITNENLRQKLLSAEKTAYEKYNRQLSELKSDNCELVGLVQLRRVENEELKKEIEILKSNKPSHKGIHEELQVKLSEAIKQSITTPLLNNNLCNEKSMSVNLGSPQSSARERINSVMNSSREEEKIQHIKTRPDSSSVLSPMPSEAQNSKEPPKPKQKETPKLHFLAHKSKSEMNVLRPHSLNIELKSKADPLTKLKVIIEKLVKDIIECSTTAEGRIKFICNSRSLELSSTAFQERMNCVFAKARKDLQGKTLKRDDITKYIESQKIYIFDQFSSALTSRCSYSIDKSLASIKEFELGDEGPIFSPHN